MDRDGYYGEQMKVAVGVGRDRRAWPRFVEGICSTGE